MTCDLSTLRAIILRCTTNKRDRPTFSPSLYVQQAAAQALKKGLNPKPKKAAKAKKGAKEEKDAAQEGNSPKDGGQATA